MPPKKKKVPLSADCQGEDQELVDVFSYLDLVEDCLDRAESSQTACLEGILKADITLTHSRGDADIGFIVLVKRAELLYIAVKHNYDTNDLSEKHSNPLASCVRDCETILKSVSSDDQASKSIYEKAKTLYTSAMRLSKALELSNRAQATAESARESQRVFKQYNPTKTLFKHISKINPYLLQDVVNCYKNSKLFCRRCYYKQKRQVAIGTGLHCQMCKKTVQPLVLMPASKMCQNFNQSKVVAIPSPPKTLMSKFNKHKPFQMCRNHDHSGCYEKSATGDTWFAHSIEELVIWTVERHYDCTFKEYVARHHKDSDPPNHSLFSSTTGRAEVERCRERNSVSTEPEYEYYPEECLFHDVASIPQRLLLDIIECYRLVKAYCMRCFYKENQKGIITVQRRTNITMCSVCQKDWDSVSVIPASNLCWNFGELEELPIASWPRGKPTKDPFEYCRKSDHFRCFRVYVDTDFWYPHSVEEMVIWTVERERKCTFSQFIETLSRLPPEVSEGSPKQSEPVIPSPFASVNPATGTGPGITQTYLQASLNKQPLSGQVNPQIPGKKIPQVAVPVSSVPANSLSKSPRVLTASTIDLVSPTAKFHPNIGAPVTGKPVSNFMRVSSSFGNAVVSPTKSVLPSLVQRNATMLSQAGASKKHLDMNMVNYPPLPNHPNSGFIDPRTGNQHQSSVYSQQQFKSSEANLMTEPMFAQGPVFVNSGAIASPREIPQQKTVTDLSKSNSNLFVVGFSNGLPNVANMTVIATAHNSEISGRPNYRIAPISYGDGLSSTSSLQPSKAVPQVFKFSEVNFKGVSDMPLSLLQGIALSMKKKMEVCRKCFYGDRTISHWDKPENVCSNGEHQWMNPIIVIPGCDLCDNEPCYKQGEFVAIPPLPPVANIKKCKQKNHHKCFAKSMESNERLAHSVEELVIWIVESKEECLFEQYVLHKLHLHVPVSSSDTTKLHSSVQPLSSPPVQVSTSTVPAIQEISKPVTIKGSTATVSNVAEPLRVTYIPKDTEFTSIKDIPSELLCSVAECYHHRMLVCRICFFDSNCKTLSSRKGGGGITSSECENGHTPWKQVIVIPASALCVSPSNFVPIPPLPKHMKHSSSSFMVCKKEEHNTCYAMSKGTNPWFPHTVEELVIWTVEREKDRSFEDVYKEFLSYFLGTGTNPVYQRQQQQQQLYDPQSSSSIKPKSGTSYVDSVPVFNPSEVPAKFSSGLQAPFLNFEDAVYLTSSSTGEHTTTNINTNSGLPSQSGLHQGLFDFSNFTPTGQYNYSGGVAKSPMGLEVPSDVNRSTAGSQTMTASDALEYFPALLGGGNSTTDAGGNPLSVTGNPIRHYGFANAFGMDQSFQPGGFNGRENQASGQMLDANQYQNETALQNWNRVLSEKQSDSFTQRLNEPLPPSQTSQNVMERDWSGTVGQTKPTPYSVHPPGFKSMVQDDTKHSSQNTASNANPTVSRDITSVEPKTGSNATVDSALAVGAKWSDLLDSHDLDASFGEDTYGIDLPRMPNSEPLVLENATKKGSHNGGKSKNKRGKKNGSKSEDTLNGGKSSKPAVENARPQQNGHHNGSSNKPTVKNDPTNSVISTEGTENPGANGRSNEVPHSFNITLEHGILSEGSITTSSDLVFEKKNQLVTTANVAISNVITSHSRMNEAAIPRCLNAIGFELHQAQPTTAESALPLLPVSTIATEHSIDLHLESSSNQLQLESSTSDEDQSFEVPRDTLVNEQQPMQLTMLERDLTAKSSLFASVMAAKAGTSGSVSPIFSEDKENDHNTNLNDFDQGAMSTHQEIGHHAGNLVSSNGLEMGNTENVFNVNRTLYPANGVLSEDNVDTNGVVQPELDHDENMSPLLELNNAQVVPAPGNLQLPEIQVTVSDPTAVDDSGGHACGFIWKAILRGQDLKNLFSVSCHTTCSQLVEKAEHVFKIVNIEGFTSPIDVHTTTWESKKGEAILQGLVIVTIMAFPPPTKKSTEYHCEVQVNVGFSELLTFNLQLIAEGSNDHPHIAEPVLNGKIAGPELNDQLTYDPIPMDDSSGSMLKWDLLSTSSSSSDELGVPNIEGEDQTLQHVPIEDWGCSLTDDIN